MKAFFLLVLLFLTFLLIASTSLAQVDLTPDVVSVSAASGVEEVVVIQSAPADYQVISIQSDPPVLQDTVTLQVPVTGATVCTDPYVVRSGDMLSGIAELCNTTVAAIRIANPEIRNANLIYPGQSLRIPVGGESAAIPLPVTGKQSEFTSLAAPQVVANPVTSAPATAGLTAPSAGALIRPGTGIQVTGLAFPANTPVYIAIGPQDTGYSIVASGITDPNGSVVSNIIVPTAPDPTQPWVVVIATTDSPVIQAASQAFYITAP